MEEETKTSKQNNERFLKRYDTVFSFLGLELVALLFFGFGGATGTMILKVLGALLAFLAFPFAENAMGKEKLKKSLITLIPLLVFFLLLGLSGFWMAYYQDSIGYGILSGVLQFLGLIALMALGFCLKCIPSLKKETVVFALLCGLAVYVLLTGLYSLARYGGFYAAIYKGQYYYFDGVIFPIDKETKALVGFQFLEASLSYGKVAAFLLASSGAGLFFKGKTKKDWKFYLVFIGLPLIGLLDLILVPHTRALLILAVIYLFAGIASLLYRKLQKNKKAAQIVTRVAYFGLIAVAAIGVGILFIDAMTGVISNANIPYISSNLRADKAFFGSIRKIIQAVIYGSSANAELGRFNLSSFLFGVSSLQSVGFSKTFEFNLLYMNGVPMFLLMLFLLFMAIRGLRSYLVEDGIDAMKGMMVMILLGAFLYYSCFSDLFPFVHELRFVPVLQTSIPLALAFVFGYTFDPAHYSLKKGVAHEE